jgi:hypothetical protein
MLDDYQLVEVFLFIELTASTAHIIQMGWVTKSPRPAVRIATIGVTIIMISAPGTVAYNMPSGPKKKESRKATPALFCVRIMTSTGFCSLIQQPLPLNIQASWESPHLWFHYYVDPGKAGFFPHNEYLFFKLLGMELNRTPFPVIFPLPAGVI